MRTRVDMRLKKSTSAKPLPRDGSNIEARFFTAIDQARLIEDICGL
jgi:hypothetical protein